MKILLHIGQSKTGTSAIQAFLTHNRAKLLDAGIFYPMPRRYGLTLEVSNHNALADSLLGISRYPYLSADQYFRQFFDESQRLGAERMILSAENFWGGEPRVWNIPDETSYWARYTKKLETLSSYLRGHDLTIVIYLRPQIEWLSSLTAHNIAWGWIPVSRTIVRSLYESDGQHFQMHKPLLRYKEKLDLWKNIFRPEAMAVTSYTRNALPQGNVILDFIHRADIGHISFSKQNTGVIENESLSPEYVEVKKILNHSPKSMDEERVVIKCLARLSAQSPMRRPYTLEPDVVAAIDAYVADGNSELSREYIGGAHPFCAKSDIGDSQGAHLSEQQIADAMRRFRAEYVRSCPQWQITLERVRRIGRTRLRRLHALAHRLKRSFTSREELQG